MSGRFVGIDYGSKRVGLAISDPVGSIASPFKTLSARSTPSEQVQAVIEATSAEYDIDEWVVGHPLNMDGSEGPQAKLSGRFAKLLAGATGAPVHLWDERLSSVQADTYLAEAGATRKQKETRRDMLAAQVILQTFLDARSLSEE